MTRVHAYTSVVGNIDLTDLVSDDRIQCKVTRLYVLTYFFVFFFEFAIWFTPC